ncbi:hypothetical protein CWATWH0402_4070 [Crocosphaera watsonii WH 0402]|uniref:Uncharacterized protein n=1 Tax=Crocosphaera watsonii WH 0402 TaxID=1284629 RepID=T2JQC5_CROWT|nr:hypothetical protein CWATWH0402_4070 [Crocosphaera watsonii WH 0402]
MFYPFELLIMITDYQFKGCMLAFVLAFVSAFVLAFIYRQQ